MATTECTQEYTTSYAQAALDLAVAQESVGDLVGMQVAEALFAPVVETLQSAEDAMVEALYQRYGGDEATLKGWVFQSAGFGTD